MSATGPTAGTAGTSDTAGPQAGDAPLVEPSVHAAVARIHGEPLMQLPLDLYIPPDALEIFLDTFEGPLDLLLYLIRRQNFNILDIPMAEVTRQYLTYIEQIRGRNLELAGEYLLMAALLIDIKSRMLLPVRKADSNEEVEDPRAELARRLLEYERIKYGSQQIDKLPQIGRDFLQARAHLELSVLERLPDVDAADLRAAWSDIVRRARLIEHHRITRAQLSVREHMTHILRSLQDRRFAEFLELFDTSAGLPVVVVTFIALLELSKESLVEVTQAAAYAPIYVRLSYVPS
jgi:segregation and condensation protein A